MEREAALERLQGDLRERDAALKQLHAKLREHEAIEELLRGVIQERDSAVEGLRGDLQEREAALVRLRGDLQDREAALERLQGLLQNLASNPSSNPAENTTEHEAELAVAHERAQLLEDMLHRTSAHADSLQAAVARVEGELRAAADEPQTLRATAAEAATLRDAAQEADALRAGAAERKRQIRRLESELHNAREEMEVRRAIEETRQSVMTRMEANLCAVMEEGETLRAATKAAETLSLTAETEVQTLSDDAADNKENCSPQCRPAADVPPAAAQLPSLPRPKRRRPGPTASAGPLQPSSQNKPWSGLGPGDEQRVTVTSAGAERLEPRAVAERESGPQRGSEDVDDFHEGEGSSAAQQRSCILAGHGRGNSGLCEGPTSAEVAGSGGAPSSPEKARQEAAAHLAAAGAEALRAELAAVMQRCAELQARPPPSRVPGETHGRAAPRFWRDTSPRAWRSNGSFGVSVCGCVEWLLWLLQAHLEMAEEAARQATERALAAEGRLGDTERQVRRLGTEAAVMESEIAACQTAAAAKDAAIAQLCRRLEHRAAVDPNPNFDTDVSATTNPELEGSPCQARPVPRPPGHGTVSQATREHTGAGQDPDPQGDATPGSAGGPADAVDRLVGAWRGACAERDRRIAKLLAQLAQV